MIVEIVFAAGCFWGVEKHFESLEGVVDVKSGYTGGSYEYPTYKKVLKYRNNYTIQNHTEAVQITFDNTKITANELIRSFWEIHDPTQYNKQGNDIGNNYRSALFYTTPNQKKIAYDTKATYQTLLKEHGFGKIVTQIEPLKKFWDAEEYHQDYLKKNIFGYCPNHSTGVKFTKDTTDNYKAKYITPFDGKEIIVIDAEFFCPYCDKFKKDVSSKYSGSLPLRTTHA
ncbi:MAG: peptide-methionine (S)-S-oxide reductase MsrA, partial [Campylobacterota bacterium]|nr:peptide-methionine (S)-S-oxide reductase MsrA [Campylobacterota bacterium]